MSYGRPGSISVANVHLSLDEITSRIKLSVETMRVFKEIDETRSRKFLDPSVLPVTLSGTAEAVSINQPEIAQDVPIGQSNLLTATLLVKLAVVAINRPDWHVVAMMPEVDPQSGEPTGKMVPDPDSALIWRQYMRDEWDRKGWQRVFLRMLLKRYVCGLGAVRWYWDDKGIEFEHIQSWDYGVNPFVIDWQNPGYGKCTVRMSLRDAAERYPTCKQFEQMMGGDQSSAQSDKQIVYVDIYWDKDTEAHIYGAEWVTHKSVAKNKDPKANLYNRVPFLFMEGDIHPGKTPFPIGDAVLAAGAQAQISDLDTSITQTAKAGVGFTLLDTGSGGFDQAQLDALRKGESQQFIGVKGLDVNNLPVHRVAGEELRQSVMIARKEARDDMLSLIGITDQDLGLFGDAPRFATQVAAAAQKGGARQNQARSEYETCLNRAGAICLWLFKQFGGPYKHPETGEVVASDEHVALHEAAMRVTEVKVIESSTAYKDPTIEQQQSMQVYQLDMQSVETWIQLCQMGIYSEMPDLRKSRERVARAFGVNQTDQIWITVPKMEQPAPEEDKPKVSIAYKDLPDDTKRSAEAAAGLQSSQLPPVQEAPDASPIVDLEKQARDHLHETGLHMSKQAHEKEMAVLANAAAQQQAAQQAKLAPKPTKTGAK